MANYGIIMMPGVLVVPVDAMLVAVFSIIAILSLIHILALSIYCDLNSATISQQLIPPTPTGFVGSQPRCRRVPFQYPRLSEWSKRLVDLWCLVFGILFFIALL